MNTAPEQPTPDNNTAHNDDVNDLPDPFAGIDVTLQELQYAKAFIDLLNTATLEKSGLPDDVIESLHDPSPDMLNLEENPVLR